MTHTALDIDYRDEELKIKFNILVKPAGVCVYVRERLKGKKRDGETREADREWT